MFGLRVFFCCSLIALASGFPWPSHAESDPNRERSWHEYGIEFGQDEATVSVARVSPGSMAAKLGFKPGDVVVGDWLNGFLGPDGAKRIHATMARMLEDWEGKREWRMDLHRPSVNADLSIVLKFPPDTAQVEERIALPPALSHLVGDAAMVALWNHEAGAVDTPDMADAAMRILFALSYHVAGCHGPEYVSIPIQINLTTTTRDGLGVERGSETETFNKELKVRPAFANLARKTASYYSDNVLNARFRGVRDLISQDTCDGPRLRRLEEGLAKAAGVVLPPSASEASTPGSLGDDWRGFVAECRAASYPAVTNNDVAAARICVLFEAAARQMGDPDVYAELQQSGMAAGGDWPQDLKDRFNAEFDPLYRGDQQGEVWERVRTYLQENGL